MTRKSAPLGTTVFIFIAIVMPTALPNIGPVPAVALKRLTLRDTAKRLDLLGAFLSIAASVLLVFSMQQGGTQYSWRSAAIITTLFWSGLLWAAFLTWQWWLDAHFKGSLEPIFPWRLARKRFYMGMLLYVLCLSRAERGQLVARPLSLIQPGIHFYPASHSTS